MLLAGTLVGLSCAGCGNMAQENPENLKLEKVTEEAEDTKGVVKLTLWGAKDDQKMLGEIVEDFKKEYEKKGTFEITIEAVEETGM